MKKILLFILGLFDLLTCNVRHGSKQLHGLTFPIMCMIPTLRVDSNVNYLAAFTYSIFMMAGFEISNLALSKDKKDERLNNYFLKLTKKYSRYVSICFYIFVILVQYKFILKSNDYNLILQSLIIIIYTELYLNNGFSRNWISKNAYAAFAGTWLMPCNANGLYFNDKLGIKIFWCSLAFFCYVWAQDFKDMEIDKYEDGGRTTLVHINMKIFGLKKTENIFMIIFILVYSLRCNYHYNNYGFMIYCIGMFLIGILNYIINLPNKIISYNLIWSTINIAFLLDFTFTIFGKN